MRPLPMFLNPFSTRPLLRILVGLAATAPGRAAVIEEQISLPVQAANGYGKAVAQPIVVTLFHDEALPPPYPLLVLNHGRAPEAQRRAEMGRARYGPVSLWFARQGFLVAVPTRIGYGVSGGDDLEDTGPCLRKNYPPAYAAAVEQTLQVLAALRQRPDAAAEGALVVGQSFGGATAIALASRNPPGVRASINFAGGGGGNPETMPQNPCAQPALAQLFAGWGQTARLPTLWLYAENDRYFGPTLPRQWFKAFQAAGGVGEFVSFEPVGDDGHALFSRAAPLWQPRVLAFLRANGFGALPARAGRP